MTFLFLFLFGFVFVYLPENVFGEAPLVVVLGEVDGLTYFVIVELLVGYDSLGLVDDVEVIQNRRH